MRIALFATCLVDGLYPGVGTATVALLRRLGHTVVFPEGQSCCGQMHVNSGYAGAALPLVRNHVRAFAGEEVVVVPSGSCAGALRHQHGDLAGRARDPRLAAEVAELAARTYELSELLVDVLGTVDVGAWYPHRAAYHPTCHSLRVLGVGDRPVRLLAAVEDLELVEPPGAETCCGFGGTFAVKNPDVSGAMLADKITSIERTGATRCVAGDASCLMHIGGGLSRRGSGVRPVHLAEVLASTRDEPAA